MASVVRPKTGPGQSAIFNAKTRQWTVVSRQSDIRTRPAPRGFSRQFDRRTGKFRLVKSAKAVAAEIAAAAEKKALEQKVRENIKNLQGLSAADRATLDKIAISRGLKSSDQLLASESNLRSALRGPEGKTVQSIIGVNLANRIVTEFKRLDIERTLLENRTKELNKEAEGLKTPAQLRAFIKKQEIHDNAVKNFNAKAEAAQKSAAFAEKRINFVTSVIEKPSPKGKIIIPEPSEIIPQFGGAAIIAKETGARVFPKSVYEGTPIGRLTEISKVKAEISALKATPPFFGLELISPKEKIVLAEQKLGTLQAKSIGFGFRLPAKRAASEKAAKFQEELTGVGYYKKAPEGVVDFDVKDVSGIFVSKLKPPTAFEKFETGVKIQKSAIIRAEAARKEYEKRFGPEATGFEAFQLSAEKAVVPAIAISGLSLGLGAPLIAAPIIFGEIITGAVGGKVAQATVAKSVPKEKAFGEIVFGGPGAKELGLTFKGEPIKIRVTREQALLGAELGGFFATTGAVGLLGQIKAAALVKQPITPDVKFKEFQSKIEPRGAGVKAFKLEAAGKVTLKGQKQIFGKAIVQREGVFATVPGTTGGIEQPFIISSKETARIAKLLAGPKQSLLKAKEILVGGRVKFLGLGAKKPVFTTFESTTGILPGKQITKQLATGPGFEATLVAQKSSFATLTASGREFAGALKVLGIKTVKTVKGLKFDVITTKILGFAQTTPDIFAGKDKLFSFGKFLSIETAKKTPSFIPKVFKEIPKAPLFLGKAQTLTAGKTASKILGKTAIQTKAILSGTIAAKAVSKVAPAKLDISLAIPGSAVALGAGRTARERLLQTRAKKVEIDLVAPTVLAIGAVPQLSLREQKLLLPKTATTAIQLTVGAEQEIVLAPAQASLIGAKAVQKEQQLITPPIVITGPELITGQKQVLGVSFKTFFDVTPVQKQKQFLLTRAVTERIIPTTKTITKPPPPVSLPPLPSVKFISSEKGLEESFKVFAIKAGKPIQISKKPLPKSKALALGAKEILGTPRATFIIKGTGFKIPKAAKDPFFQTVKSQFRKKAPGVFVEKTEFRIDTPGELAGITFKGLETLTQFPGLRKKKKRKKKRR